MRFYVIEILNGPEGEFLGIHNCTLYKKRKNAEEVKEELLEKHP